MPSIPINPSLITGAGLYTAPGQATSMNLCSRPSEGLKSISMQFQFNTLTGWQVNFPNSPNPPMSQLAAMFVDTTNCNFDVNIYFPDSGYQVRVEQQGGRMIPVLTGAKTGVLPSFYVLLDSGGQVDDSVCNIIAMNQFLPEFSSGEIQRIVTYGYGASGDLVPGLAQSTTFYYDSGTAGLPATIINANQWFITSILINGFIEGTGNNSAMTLTDGTVPLATAWWSGTTGPTAQIFLQIDPFNYISSGNGLLQLFSVGLNAPTAITYRLFVNIMGGILVP